MLPTHVVLPLKHMALDTVEVGEEHITVHVHSTQQAAMCPACYTPSTRPAGVPVPLQMRPAPVAW